MTALVARQTQVMQHVGVIRHAIQDAAVERLGALELLVAVQFHGEADGLIQAELGRSRGLFILSGCLQHHSSLPLRWT